MTTHTTPPRRDREIWEFSFSLPGGLIGAKDGLDGSSPSLAPTALISQSAIFVWSGWFSGKAPIISTYLCTLNKLRAAILMYHKRTVMNHAGVRQCYSSQIISSFYDATNRKLLWVYLFTKKQLRYRLVFLINSKVLFLFSFQCWFMFARLF